MARAASSSSEEDKKEQIADKDLKKITPENNSDEITEGSGQRETRQIQTAEPVQGIVFSSPLTVSFRRIGIALE